MSSSTIWHCVISGARPAHSPAGTYVGGLPAAGFLVTLARVV